MVRIAVFIVACFSFFAGHLSALDTRVTVKLSGKAMSAYFPIKGKVFVMKEEGASVKVLNGTPVGGLAGVTGDYLTSLGVNVVAVGDADGTGYDYTSVYDYSGKPYALRYFKELLGLNTFRIHGRYDQESDVDVTIILGADWANNNPMP